MSVIDKVNVNGGLLFKKVAAMANKELVIKLLKERCLECSICAMSLNSSLTVSIKALFLSRLDRRRGGEFIVIARAIGKGSQLDILVEAMGRVNFDKSIHDRKGITEKVELLTYSTRFELTGWNVYNLPVDAVFASNKKFAEGGKTDMPAYYRATFNLDKTGDTFLDMQTWGKGMVWVNGKAIGRFF